MFIINRKPGQGMQLAVPPSERTTFINLQLRGIDENDFGRLEASLGLIAPKRVRYDWHESMQPQDFPDDPELSENDRKIVRDWAARGGTKARNNNRDD